MKGRCTLMFLLLVTALTGAISARRVILENDEPSDQQNAIKLCNYSNIWIGQPPGLYDQYLKARSLGANVLSGSVPCAPQPTLFQMKHPFPNYEFFSPSFVTLRRCGGNCGQVHPSILQCVVKKTHAVTVRVFDTHKKEYCGIQLQNHTKCECECVTKASECDDDETFDENTCKCIKK